MYVYALSLPAVSQSDSPSFILRPDERREDEDDTLEELVLLPRFEGGKSSRWLSDLISKLVMEWWR